MSGDANLVPELLEHLLSWTFVAKRRDIIYGKYISLSRIVCALYSCIRRYLSNVLITYTGRPTRNIVLYNIAEYTVSQVYDEDSVSNI